MSLESSPRHFEKDSVFSDVVLSDGELIRRICAGEVALFERVMRRHNARVFRAVRAILGGEHAAEEVMQGVYLQAYKRLPEFAERAATLRTVTQRADDRASSFATWLLRIAVHESRRQARSSYEHGLSKRSLDQQGLNEYSWEGVETEMSNLSAAGAEARSLNGVQLDEAACRDGEASPEAACVEAERTDSTHSETERGDSERGDSERNDAAIANIAVANITAAGEQRLLATVEAAIDSLPEALRTVLVLCQVEHLSVAETAATLELSAEVVNTRLRQARAMLYDSLAERAEAIAPGVYAFHLTRCDRIVAATMKQINSR